MHCRRRRVINKFVHLLVSLVQVHDFVLQLLCLSGGNFEVLQIGTRGHLFGIIVAHFGLHQVRAQQSVRDKCAGQATLQNVIAHLQAEMIARYVLLQLRRLRWIELHGESQWPGICAKEFRNRLLQIQPDTRIRWRLIGQTKVILLNDVQSGTDGVDQIAALGFTLWRGEQGGISRGNIVYRMGNHLHQWSHPEWIHRAV